MSVMDTTGFSQIGKYGTLSLLKHSGDGVVTSFGIDSDELTFGRDPTCSVRLYYPDVSVLHCKIVFEERKAFLAVLGEVGVTVDGCEVYPNTSNSGAPTMVPLSNDSEIEIRKKRFRFTYPPKDMRATLFAAPSPITNRKPRLSMIQSAQVFSPRPSPNPRENLRILQSPLKNQWKSPAKPSSRLAQTLDDEVEEVVLVDGNHPRVVEEDRDLVILEDVPVVMPLVQPSPSKHPPRTPSRTKRNTLHRAVLIRSAHRAVRRAEEEEREEMEVLETVVAEPDSDEEEPREEEDRNIFHDEDVEMEDAEPTPKPEAEQSTPGWRKSLSQIWPFGGGENKAAEEQNEETYEQDQDQEDEQIQIDDCAQEEAEQEEEDDFGASLAPLPKFNQTPARRPLGSFFTPQVNRTTGAGPVPMSQGGPQRLSLGGEARRVPISQPWKVKDIVVAPDALRSSPQKGQMDPPPMVNATPRRQQLSAEERKAIAERRRSALRQPDNFFPGGVPGMSPSKSRPSLAATPMRPSMPLLYSSPAKESGSQYQEEQEEEALDTRSLLDKMKETVEVMKRRKSVALDATPRRPMATPRKSIGGAGDGEVVFESVKKLDLSRTPATIGKGKGKATLRAIDSDDEDENDENLDRQQRLREEEEEEYAGPSTPTNRRTQPEEPFSLLRPQARIDMARKSLVFDDIDVDVQMGSDSEAEPEAVIGVPEIETMDVDEEASGLASGAGDVGEQGEQEEWQEQEQEQEEGGSDEEEDEDEMPPPPVKPTPRSRLLRGSKQVVVSTDNASNPSLLSVESKDTPASRRRSPRALSPKPTAEAETQGSAEVDSAVFKPTPAANRRLGTRSGESSSKAATTTTTPATATNKRTRTPARRAPAATTTTDEEDREDEEGDSEEDQEQEQEQEQPEPPVPATSRARGKAAAAATAATGIKPPAKRTAATRKVGVKDEPAEAAPVRRSRIVAPKATVGTAAATAAARKRAVRPPAAAAATATVTMGTTRGKRKASEMEDDDDEDVNDNDNDNRDADVDMDVDFNDEEDPLNMDDDVASSTLAKGGAKSGSESAPPSRPPSRIARPASAASSRPPSAASNRAPSAASNRAPSAASNRAPSAASSRAAAAASAASSNRAPSAASNRATAAGKGKQKAGVSVKQEEEEEEDVAAGVAVGRTTTTRSRSGLKTPAPVRARAGRKTPASAPAAVAGGRGKDKDKENTPDAGAGEVGEGVVKLKVSRSRATKSGGATTTTTASASGSRTTAASGSRTASGSKVPMARAVAGTRSRAAVVVKEEPEEEVRVRVTRATRTRTKTG